MNSIRFDLCVFCQKKTKEKLKDPRNLKILDHIDASYTSLNDILILYKAKGFLTEYDHLNEMNEWFMSFKTNGAK